LHLAYFGRIDPQSLGIDYSLPSQDGPMPGWHAISVSLFRGGYWQMVPNGGGAISGVRRWDYSYFLEYEPVAMAGYSIFIYNISLEEANRMRNKLGFDELPSP
jgi:hypothetical protein